MNSNEKPSFFMGEKKKKEKEETGQENLIKKIIRKEGNW